MRRLAAFFLTLTLAVFMGVNAAASTSGADARINKLAPTTNYGSISTLRGDADDYDSLLAFSVTGWGAGSTATLRVTLTEGGVAPMQVYATSAFTESTVTWNTAPAKGALVGTLPAAATGATINANISGITGNGTYFYRISSSSTDGMSFYSREGATPPQLIISGSGSPSPSTSVTPSPSVAPSPSASVAPSPSAPGGDPILMVAGDIACAPGFTITPGGCHHQATANLLGPATAVQTLGDNQYNEGTLANFNGSYHPSWGVHKAKTHPGIGNHEGTSATSGLGYCQYFGAAAHCSGAGNQNNAAYYSYNLGSWHIIVLNSNCGAGGGCASGSAQYNWLVADLAADTHLCTMAVWHHPRFSSGDHGSSTSFQPFWQALYNDRAEIVLNGHDHDYERFVAQSPTGVADSNGLVEYVVGTGGKNLYQWGSIKANSVVRNNSTFGVMKLVLHSTSWDTTFLPEAGKTFTDSSSGTCR